MASDLGDYLSARRAQIGPDQVDLPSHGRRRVPGLRREEVALLAGVSVDYYVRLEQGRERTPSAQVLDALASALRLDADARRHLFDLAGTAAPRRTPGVSERVDPSLRRLMDAWSGQPALVYNRAYDVLAANELATALFGGWAHSSNLMHVVFTDPAARSFYADWDEVARDAVAGFRLGHGQDPDDPRMRAVLSELLSSSGSFANLWSRHEARGKSLHTKRFVHPEVGPLTLTMQAFDVRAAPGQELVVYDAEPGSASADALAILGTLVASEAR